MNQKTKYLILGAFCMLLFITGVFWGASANVKAERSNEYASISNTLEDGQADLSVPNPKNAVAIGSQPEALSSEDTFIEESDEGVIPKTNQENHQNEISIKQSDGYLSSIEAVVDVVERLNARHINSWITGSGWYLYEFEIVEPNIDELFLPNSQQKLTSNHTSHQNWLFIDDQSRIIERVILMKDSERNILQEVVNTDRMVINLTGYKNNTLHNSSIYSDPVYGQHILDHFGLIELLKNLPNGAEIQAKVDKSVTPNQFVIFTSQKTGENPPVLNYLFTLNNETGEFISWEAGYSDGNGEFIVEFRQLSFNFYSLNGLPQIAEKRLLEGRNILQVVE